MIKRKDELLQNIAAGLNRLENHKVYNIKVTFHVGNDTYDFSVPQALDCLSNDIYWDERGNWSEAERATLDTF
jgi:hypothetical protein